MKTKADTIKMTLVDTPTDSIEETVKAITIPNNTSITEKITQPRIDEMYKPLFKGCLNFSFIFKFLFIGIESVGEDDLREYFKQTTSGESVLCL